MYRILCFFMYDSTPYIFPPFKSVDYRLLDKFLWASTSVYWRGLYYTSLEESGPCLFDFHCLFFEVNKLFWLDPVDVT